MEIASILRDRAGNIYLKSALWILAAALFISVGLSIYHVYHAIGAVREDVNEAVLSVAAANVSEFYGGARESDGYARHPDGSGSFSANISTGEVLSALARSTDASSVSGSTIETDSYTVTVLSVSYVNQSGSVLQFATEITVVVPLDVGSVSIPIEKDIVVRSKYDTRF